jgi:hypothetical protein
MASPYARFARFGSGCPLQPQRRAFGASCGVRFHPSRCVAHKYLQMNILYITQREERRSLSRSAWLARKALKPFL